MTETKANLRYLRISPRKTRLVADLVRGKSVKESLARLKFADKKSAPVISKLIKSAYSNAKNNFKKEISDADLYIKKISVDEGPTLKRYMPRARGTAYMIRKRTSHISVVLEEQPKIK
ncbi:MAG: 50S ribosomal protein L22 [Patescibacteria group bacterium]